MPKVDIGRLWAVVATVSDTNAIRVQPKSTEVLHPIALDRVVLVVPARPTSNQYTTNVPECPEKHHHFILDREVRYSSIQIPAIPPARSLQSLMREHNHD